MTAPDLTKSDRGALIRIAKNRAKLAVREAEARRAVLVSEVVDEATVE